MRASTGYSSVPCNGVGTGGEEAGASVYPPLQIKQSKSETQGDRRRECEDGA